MGFTYYYIIRLKLKLKSPVLENRILNLGLTIWVAVSTHLVSVSTHLTNLIKKCVIIASEICYKRVDVS
jgi:hypothetical protein